MVAVFRGATNSADPYAQYPIPDALAFVCHALGWSSHGSSFGRIAPRGGRVLVKPNWVVHRNHGPWGMGPLVTHPAVIRPIVDELLATDVATVIVGDAPLQSCDFVELIRWGGLGEWAEDRRLRDPRLRPLGDFRRTTSRIVGGVPLSKEDVISESEFVLFDLGGDSLLEPVTSPRNEFRVTQYPPAKMRKTHAAGRHQYLIVREALLADLVINVPKLKTHKKAGLTCALKNLVGINGNKEFLPHHRVGGAADGGDCYPGHSNLKRLHETLLDAANGARSVPLRYLLTTAALALTLVNRAVVDKLGVEGAWSGNDTVWRMCLDLNRILLYGRPDGTLANEPQRRVVSIVDGIIAGQGDGPLAPQNFDLGVIFGGENSAAVDWVGAQLLGYEPSRIPLVRESFTPFRWPLSRFTSSEVVLKSGGLPITPDLGTVPKPASYPAGWLSSVTGSRRGTVHGATRSTSGFAEEA